MKIIHWTVAAQSKGAIPIIAIVKVIDGLPDVGDVVLCVETTRKYRVESLVTGMNYEAVRDGARGLTLRSCDEQAEGDLVVNMHLVNVP